MQVLHLATRNALRVHSRTQLLAPKDCHSNDLVPNAGARGGGLVEMRHVDAAVQEMFSAVHMQLLGRACRLDKLLLVALMLETRATGAL